MENVTDLYAPYLPGEPDEKPGPLGRFLPPVPRGAASAWLEGRAPAGSWVLDPFGASPQLAVEMARAGWRVLVTVNNPVLGFLLEVQASAPTRQQLNAALAALAGARKGGERLETHISGLYEVECEQCAARVPAAAFLWHKNAGVPAAAAVRCPRCGFEGEQPVSPGNLERLAALGKSALSRARALERVAAPDDPTRPLVEQALNCYPARALYALFTLMNRLEGLEVSPLERMYLQALLLSACDEANTLWPHPAPRSRPRQLVIPPGYRENNLWLALENAVETWAPQAAGAAQAAAVPVARWPAQPPESGGISLFPGRLRSLQDALPAVPIAAVVTALPRPNQAFWTLSALWSGWLWGREAVQPLKGVLARQRYDWNWYANGLETILQPLAGGLQPGAPLFLLIGEGETSFYASALTAAHRSGFTLRGIALRPGQNAAQLTWERETPLDPPADSSAGFDGLARQAVSAVLTTAGEPSAYPALLTGAAAALCGARAPKLRQAVSAAEAFNQVQLAANRVFTDSSFLAHLSASPNHPESGLWWLAQETPAQTAHSLADLAEMSIVRAVLKNPGAPFAALDRAACAALPGLLTPPANLLLACLDSYAAPETANQAPGTPANAAQSTAVAWTLKKGEQPAARRADLKEMVALLTALGQRLGYTARGEQPLTWHQPDGQPVYSFFLTASAVISRFVYDPANDPGRSVIVLPGGRANLLSFKLHRDPRLERAVAAGWRFLKFRQVRLMAQTALPAVFVQADWEKSLQADPLEYEPTQLAMI
jgi:hypothetical protein